VWEQARRRYRRQMALFWAGSALIAAGLFFGQKADPLNFLALIGSGLWAWSGYSLFGPNPLVKGWATRYNPLRALREEV